MSSLLLRFYLLALVGDFIGFCRVMECTFKNLFLSLSSSVSPPPAPAPPSYGLHGDDPDYLPLGFLTTAPVVFAGQGVLFPSHHSFLTLCLMCCEPVSLPCARCSV